MLGKIKFVLGVGAAAAASAGLVYWMRQRARAAESPADGLEASQDVIDALDALAFDDDPVVQADINALDDVLGLDALPGDGAGDYVEVDVIVDDVGELYGVHTGHASDTSLGY